MKKRIMKITIPEFGLLPCNCSDNCVLAKAINEGEVLEEIPEDNAPCTRISDCSLVRVEGKCMGKTCGVYLPA